MRDSPHLYILVLVHGGLDAQGDHYVREFLILFAEVDEGANFIFYLIEDVGMLE